jgi:hypothetical protein
MLAFHILLFGAAKAAELDCSEPDTPRLTKPLNQSSVRDCVRRGVTSSVPHKQMSKRHWPSGSTVLTTNCGLSDLLSVPIALNRFAWV